jgi:Superinfection immunity protein
MSITTVIVVLVIYFLPSCIAFARGHRNKHALAKFNIFGGWTIFGWITALVWAIYAEPSSYPRCRFQGVPTPSAQR